MQEKPNFFRKIVLTFFLYTIYSGGQMQKNNCKKILDEVMTYVIY